MNKKIVYGAIALTFIVAVLALLVGLGSHPTNTKAVANVTTNLPSLGLSTLTVGSGCDQAYTSCTGSTLGGRTLNVVTANTATSTLVVGCIQMYATSTATAQNITLAATSSLLTTSTGFYPVVNYGACPNL